MFESVKKIFSVFALSLSLLLFGSSQVSAAEVYFNKVYKGTGAYGEQTSPILISSGTLLAGTGFRFQSLNPADVSYSGNNVPGNFKYTNTLGVVVTIRGVVSRPEKIGSTPRAVYFYVSDASNVATGEAYLFVFPNFEDIFPGAGSIATSSDPVDDDLNSLLNNQVIVTCDPAQKYDKIVSGFHQSVAQKSDGSFVVWGQDFANNGSSDVLSPIALNASNYPAMTGTPMKATIGGAGGISTEQGVLLTTTGLFAWGAEGGVFDATLTTSSTFQKIATPTGGDANTKLPTGVTPANVTMLFASYQTLALVTTSGNVWVLTQASANLQGDGTSASATTWHKVKTGVSVDLTGITAVRGQVSSGSLNGMMALNSTGQAYVWGSSIYLGNGTAATSKSYATLMTLPTEFSSSNVPKLIGVTGGINNASTTKNTFYVLGNTGSLYALGANNLKQCGDFTTTERTSWVNVKKNSTTVFSNVSTISVQEHDAWNPSVAAVTANGDLYSWGEQERSMLGQSPVDGTFDPSMPGSFTSGTDIALFAELGGHTLVYVKEGSARFCYVGHKTNGSMGDGTSDNIDLATFNCSSTPEIDLCKPTAATPTIVATGTLTAATICAGTASTSQSITVSGTNLTADIIVTAPTGYEVSLLSASGFAASVTLPQVSSAVASTTVYLRLAATATNGASGNIVASSTGATDQTVATVAAIVNPIPATPIIDAGGPTTFCAGGNVVLTSSSATGNQWYLGGVAITGETNQTYTASAAGVYTLVITASSCSSAASAGTTVVVNPIPTTPTIDAGGPTTFCAGGSVVLTSSSATGNQWYLDGVAITDATNQTYTASAAGVYTLIITASNCSSPASAGTTVVVNPIPTTPTIGAGGPTTFCAGGSVVLTSSSATGNQWYLDAVAITDATNQTYTASAAGVYTLIITASNCSSAASAGTTVVVNPIPSTPTIGAGGPTTFCAGGSVVLTSSSATGNQWYLDAVAITGATNQTYTATTAGTYTVITTALSCSSPASAGTTVVVNAIPSTPSSITGKLRVVAGSSQTYVAAAVTGATSYTWTAPNGWTGTSTIDTLKLVAGTVGGTLSVKANANGCTSPAATATLIIVPDFDGDGLADEDDLDDDNDGILDTVENAACSPSSETCDTDGDGTPNKFDLDSDADGISDVYEANGTDVNKDGKADGAIDANGVPSSAKGGLTPPDTDKDGKTDPYDVDSDGDGIPDKEEGIKDTDGDGIPDFRDVDSDGDGIPDDKEYGPTPGKPIDTDGDGIPDYLDIDSDNDGITDKSENGAGPAILDTDKDGIPDYLDLDADGDGITDVLEANGTDADKDGRADGTADSKGVPTSASGGLTGPDTDADGKRDFQDTDSDADGIVDNVEGQGTFVKPTGKDTDKDGIDDAYDKDNGGTPIVPLDTDKDGKPDFRELDSDNDGIPDAIEAGPDPKNPVDTDKDGTPDFRDLDSDNDGIPDSVEAGPDPKNPLDTDKDGIPDFRELDSDNDGISDTIEAGPDPKNPVDTDQDGFPDYRELDSDNDGIPDTDEAGPDPSKPLDSDGDGIYDFRETDSNTDGIPDGETLLVYKSSVSQSKVASDGSFEMKFTITLKNARSVPLTSVLLQDDLTKTFPSPMQFTVVDYKTSGTLIKSTGFNGRTVTDLLAAGSTIAGKGVDSINLTIKVLANGYEGVIANIADGSAISKWGPVKRQSIDISKSGGRLFGAGVPTNNLAPKINLIIADVLTPNNDGINDKWIILRPFSSKIDVTIFNRWGQIVYKKADYQNEWDGIGTGNFLGRMLPHGTYFYLIDITEKSTGAKEVKKGYLTLKRDY